MSGRDGPFGPDRAASPLDRLIGAFDHALRRAFPPLPEEAAAGAPGAGFAADPLADPDRRLSESLMRVNHTGEVCAQALYRGQASVVRSARVRAALEQAAREESSHLQWCEVRLRELGGRTSYLEPLWYLGAYGLGCVAGIAGDEWNLGFVAETERQVVEHLDGHLRRISRSDRRSRAILNRMREDELGHATAALEAGARGLPGPIRCLMRFQGRVMTTIAHWI